MRAGLLSDPQVIARLNDQFVNTWILVDDAQRLSREGDPLGKTVAMNWEYPLDLMFLSPDGSLLSKLNSFKDLRAAHDDVGHPPAGRGKASEHQDVFFQHLDHHFGRK